MKNFLPYIFLILFFSACGRNNFVSPPIDTFSVEVREWNMMGELAYIVNQDSVIIKPIFENSVSGGKYRFAREIKAEEKQAIIDELSKTDWTELSIPDPPATVPDDDFEYGFTVGVNGLYSQYHVYHVGVDEFLDLTRLVNKMLPETNQIGYTNEYLERGMP